MKKLIILLTLALASTMFGQTALTSTTLAAAMNSTDQTVAVASLTGIAVTNPRTTVYIIDKNSQIGEYASVTAVNTTAVTMTLSRTGPAKFAHISGAYVIISSPYSPANSFYTTDPHGACPATQTQFTPWINIQTGAQWLCSTLGGVWVNGWNSVGQKGVTAAVASAAGVILPSGPLFHVTGTAAITGFTLPVGFSGGDFCIVPDGVFTWTAAGNISLAGTAVVNKLLCFQWDSNAGKWEPSYIA